MRRLWPSLYVDGLRDIPLSELKARGIDSLIFDLDNTITGWNRNELSDDTVAWFTELRAQGFKALILSNNHAPRIEMVARALDIPFVEEAGKPRRRAYLLALEVLDSAPDAAAIVGDQIFTDTLGGNRAGLMTILVRPLAWREFPGTKVSRTFEKPVLWWLWLRRERGRIYE
ncbi:MAG: YqeG family HAD IIIA-type phosphatase [Syntrophomonadaceae bacterium]|nr:YqeG family HAD IIIA-type phosphatase [Syntrophomonadaceae bacterium]